jgi:hypothetical protein
MKTQVMTLTERSRAELYKLIRQVNMDDSFRQTWNVERFIDEVEKIYHPPIPPSPEHPPIEEQAAAQGYRPGMPNRDRDGRIRRSRSGVRGITPW